MTLRFKTDENLPDEIADFLRERNFDCETVPQEGLVGSRDTVLAAHCKSEGRALITLGLDFADIRVYPPQEYPGIFVLRPGSQSLRRLRTILTAVVDLLELQQLNQRLWVCDEAGIRVRASDSNDP